MYSFTTDYGGGIVLAPALQTFCGEIARHPDFRHLTNLGEIGDSRHKGEGTSSDHNPFVDDPAGRLLVRAVDLGGDLGLLTRLRDHLNRLYAHGFPPLFSYGYTKGPDSQITTWQIRPAGAVAMHTDTGDEGHLHVSVTMRDGYHRDAPHQYVAALGSSRPWGIFPHVDAGELCREWARPAGAAHRSNGAHR